MLHSCSLSSVVESVRLYPFPSPEEELVLSHLLTMRIVYIFAGSILLGDGTVLRVVGAIIGLIGVAYVALEFIPSIEPPQNMREADGGWGAEQV